MDQHHVEGSMRILHCVNTFRPSNENEELRLRRAAATWTKLYSRSGGLVIPAHSTSFERTARNIGDQRDVPYMKDVIWEAILHSDDSNDIIMLTNADSNLVIETAEQVIQIQECGWSYRRDVDKPPKVWLSQTEMVKRSEFSFGCDLFAFTRTWWEKTEPTLPDMLLGYQGWDWVLRFEMGQDHRLKDLVYHEIHIPYWHQHRKLAPGNLYNCKMAYDWVMNHARKNEIRRSWKNFADLEDTGRRYHEPRTR